MANESTLSREELDDRIAILRDNIRQITEQAAAFSGPADEARNADRIAQQTEELERLLKHRIGRWNTPSTGRQGRRRRSGHGAADPEPETAGTLPPAG